MVYRFTIFIIIFLIVHKRGLSQDSVIDTIRLTHKEFTSVYSKSKKYPIMVDWWVTKSKVTCHKPLKRKDDFKPDPLLPNETNNLNDYVNSGFDRGHMSPAADNLCQSEVVMQECFYFSNISPQYRALNAGVWKVVEVWSRELAAKYDSVHVWAGNVGEIKKIGTVSVPEKCWKIIYVKKTNEWHCFIFKNTTEKDKKMEDFKIEKSVLINELKLKYWDGFK